MVQDVCLIVRLALDNVVSLPRPPPMADWPLGCGRRSSAPPGEPGEMPPPRPPPYAHRGRHSIWIWETPRGPRSVMRRVWLSRRRYPIALLRSPVPAPLSATRSVWRGSGGRHLPRLPRRRAGPSAAAEGPVSHGRGGEERGQARKEGRRGKRRGRTAEHATMPAIAPIS